jgi:hypothetical protein
LREFFSGFPALPGILNPFCTRLKTIQQTAIEGIIFLKVLDPNQISLD